MSEEEQLRLLASDGMLVKRPVVVTESAVLVGFRPVEWEKAFAVSGRGIEPCCLHAAAKNT